jgi:hypothetical protein
VIGSGPILGANLQPTRESADRAFHHAHVLVGNEAGDAGLPQNRLGEIDQYGVVAAQQLTHGTRPLLDWTESRPPPSVAGKRA